MSRPLVVVGVIVLVIAVGVGAYFTGRETGHTATTSTTTTTTAAPQPPASTTTTETPSQPARSSTVLVAMCSTTTPATTTSVTAGFEPTMINLQCGSTSATHVYVFRIIWTAWDVRSPITGSTTATGHGELHYPTTTTTRCEKSSTTHTIWRTRSATLTLTNPVNRTGRLVWGTIIATAPDCATYRRAVPAWGVT